MPNLLTIVVKRHMPLVRSITIGVVAAALIGGCTPFVMLLELGGPINFAMPFSFVVVVALLLTAIVSRPKGWRRGMAAGLGFSIPILAICFLIPSFDPDHLDEHARQLRFVGLLAFVLSLIVMITRASAAQNENENTI